MSDESDDRNEKPGDMNEDPFVTYRSLLFTVAYEMLGSAEDAEDVVQETWMRWSQVDQAEVDHPRAYLIRIVTRLALNHLRSISRRREEYVGEWLPEPLLTGPDLTEDGEFAEKVSIAMLTVLETLGPTERAVFVLREVFDMPYEEIANVVDKAAATVRQVAHRARKHVASRRPRMQVDPSDQRQALDRLVEVTRTGELEPLLQVLAPDVSLVSDGGGVVPAAPKPIEGAEKVAAFLIGIGRRAPGFGTTPVLINGEAAVVIEVPGQAPTVITATTAEGRVTQIYAIRNPEKLSRIDEVTTLSR